MCRHYLEDLSIDGKDNIKMDVLEVGWGMDLIWCGWGYGQVAGCSEHSIEPSGSIKCGKFVA
jgi:hypothetical protein